MLPLAWHHNWMRIMETLSVLPLAKASSRSIRAISVQVLVTFWTTMRVASFGDITSHKPGWLFWQVRYFRLEIKIKKKNPLLTVTSNDKVRILSCQFCRRGVRVHNHIRLQLEISESPWHRQFEISDDNSATFYCPPSIFYSLNFVSRTCFVLFG